MFLTFYFQWTDGKQPVQCLHASRMVAFAPRRTNQRHLPLEPPTNSALSRALFLRGSIWTISGRGEEVSERVADAVFLINMCINQLSSFSVIIAWSHTCTTFAFRRKAKERGAPEKQRRRKIDDERYCDGIIICEGAGQREEDSAFPLFHSFFSADLARGVMDSESSSEGE